MLIGVVDQFLDAGQHVLHDHLFAAVFGAVIAEIYGERKHNWIDIRPIEYKYRRVIYNGAEKKYLEFIGSSHK